MLIFYNILYILFLLCYLPFFLIQGKYHPELGMRAGIFPRAVREKIKGKRLIWLHAVSVGEVQAVTALVKDLRQAHPDFCLVISTVTASGQRVARRLTQVQDLTIYLPLDIGLVVRRVISLLNPRLFIVAETEIWPNLIINLARRGVPVALVNGRVSSSSFKGYRIIRPFLKRILQKFSLLAMQTEEDARRIIALGAPEEKVKVTGNMKFDVEKPQNQKPDLGLAEEERLFIAGSTHRGEEKIVLQVYRDLIKHYPNLRLLIAPRHIERTPEIERLISGFGFNSQRVSKINRRLPQGSQATNPVLILDTIGQLSSLYACAELVFIGGSLIPRGGQNPIEPAVFSRPIIFGPYMSNFSDIVKIFLSAKAAIRINDGQQLRDICKQLLNNPHLRRQLGRRAKEVVQKNRGATAKNMELLKSLLTS